MASSTRTSFRPRPLDNNKQLDIVRDENADLQSAGPIDQADIEATRRITNGHETLDAHNEKVRPQTARQPVVDGAGCSCHGRCSAFRHASWTMNSIFRARSHRLGVPQRPLVPYLACGSAACLVVPTQLEGTSSGHPTPMAGARGMRGRSLATFDVPAMRQDGAHRRK